MIVVDQRAVLADLIEQRRDDYAGLSRLIGRNAAYIQQFIKRGVPKKLDERDRRTLASYFGINDSLLGGPATGDMPPGTSKLVRVPRLAVGASAGAGAYAGDESATAHIGFEETWLRRLSSGKAGDLSLIKVQGDSMAPTLSDGDDILVDAGDAADRLRDGVYVLRRDEALLVKRIARNPASRGIAIKSDNPSYPSWPECRLGDIDIIGRVVWIGHKLI